LYRLRGFDLLLAATRHVVVLPRARAMYFVLAFAAIELVWMDVLVCATFPERIVAVPTVEDVSALASRNIIIAVAPVDDIRVPFVNHVALQEVVARPAVDDVFAVSSPDVLITAKASYLVIAFQTVKLVSFVGAQEQAALGAAR
jgi:hypothetical protein